ncbi:MAG: glutamate-5-semialdehyde dehydrogenase [Fervidobacterium sp.]|uniref:Gamma-glutamyl phosphate reductase n=1 Tax=Fervidobacterium gondwanense DSM 13020 TaxID=1121883 RepID=A0A1M7RX86_FERGO|nr:glutamate-5-semialdehyde dehydrogenase [Fervidobacterium gondwanense]UXF00083.1 gamma-glutamyl phosphate reductase [Fervidobacterium riparium]SHN50893.1 glutamate-5-semialdehyde dehydrogenase [Fervidobacterium gondwanense DSM 13020]
MYEDVKISLENLKNAFDILSRENSEKKNKFLRKLAQRLDESRDYIISENNKDVQRARELKVKESLVDRLVLNDKRINEMIESCRIVENLRDPVGEVVDSFVREDGLKIYKIRVPIGVIAIIYESRPNVTIETAILALKSGNTILLKGGSDALNSNRALVGIIKEALDDVGLPRNAVELVEHTDRSVVDYMLKQREYIDLVIPRGGKALIDYVVSNSRMPVLETGAGVCHIFVDESADIDKSISVIDNAKTQRPGTCNAVETLLVHKNIASKLLPKLKELFDTKRVEIRGCEETRKIIDCNEATEEDWSTEYLDLIISIKVVSSLDDAIEHIKKYSTKHSEAILTENYSNAMKFLNSVDSSTVYINASTRFTDGGQFGMGAEIGISTQKFHARGPVGLRELTTTKFVVFGNYNVRK